MKKEIRTTLWLDLLTYIIIPIVILLGTIGVIRSLLYGMFSFEFFVFLFIEIAFLVLYGYTFYHAYNRNKEGYTLFRLLILLTAVRAGMDFANTQNINEGHNFVLAFLGYIVVATIAWIYPNELYFKKRKDLFINKSKLKYTNPFKRKRVKS
jgi:uncharacterized protein (DUF983 family)